MPPARAIAIAISDSVTVSIAADTSGTLSVMPRVNRDSVLTSRGCVREWLGARRTSSNVSASSVRTRACELAGSWIRDGPLPERSGAAGRFDEGIVVAMAKGSRASR